ncbi:MAG TPA: hypothetical protein P5234_16570, partial [Thermoanaerobaculaceae bacterium]|nr:hypothetical protein [Thermoanaerobaculaceae bacterium]
MSREQVVVGAVGSGVLPEVVAGDVRYDGLGRPVIEKTPLPANSCVGSSCWNQRLIGYKAGDKVNRLTSATTGTESDASQSQGYASDARGTSRGQCGGRDAGARA